MALIQKISANFPFDSRFIEVLGSKMHYVEEGTGDPVLFLHGNPTSSYLWRNVIPHVSPGARCIALDLIGMGKSDKPDIEYRFYDHLKYVEGFIEEMGLTGLTLVMHDWGSALGFQYAMHNESNVKALAFMEAILAPVPGWDVFPEEFREAFRAFRTPDVGWDMIVNKNMFIEQVLPGGIVRKLGDKEMERYRAPYYDPPSRKPLWQWPREIPIAGKPADVSRTVVEYNRRLAASTLPKLLFYATPGALVRAPAVKWCRENLANLKTVYIGHGIHFLQEDNPDKIGEELAAWLGKVFKPDS